MSLDKKFYENGCFYKDPNLTEEKMKQTLALKANNEAFSELVNYLYDNRFELQKKYTIKCNHTNFEERLIARTMTFMLFSLDRFVKEVTTDENEAIEEDIDYCITEELMEDIQKELEIDQANERKQYKEKYDKKSFPLSEIRFQAGQQDGLNRCRQRLFMEEVKYDSKATRK